MDETVWHELVDLLPRLRRFARGLTNNAADADDLVQTACEKALSKRHQWQSDTRLDSWMYRIVQNCHLDWLRAQKVRTNHQDINVHVIASHVDGERETEHRITLDEVRQRIAKLPQDQQAVLLLVCVEGQSYRQAAQTLGVPPGTIMSRLSRARLALVQGGVTQHPALAANRDQPTSLGPIEGTEP